MPTANVNGISINYEIDGEDTGKGTIVLINGLADDLLSWGFQMPAFVAAGCRVLRFDNRGIGKTDCPAGPYTYKLMADDAKALVDHLGLSGFHLMGVFHAGGMIAQDNHAVAHPSDLKSVTLACTYGKADALLPGRCSPCGRKSISKEDRCSFRHAARRPRSGPSPALSSSERAAEAAEFGAAAMGRARHVGRRLSPAQAQRHPTNTTPWSSRSGGSRSPPSCLPLGKRTS